MPIFATGDIHGKIDIGKLTTSGLAKAGVAPTEEDYLVICGDFGLVWAWQGQTPEERYWLDWLGKKPFKKILFVDGNHENFERLNALPVEEWKGGKIHRVTDRVYHLMRGQVFDIDGKLVFTLGGARSVDREWRVENKTWWRQELPDEAELLEAERNLEKHGWRVDFAVTHCAPSMVQHRIDLSYAPDRLTNFLDYLRDRLDYDEWVFGHCHVDMDFDDGFRALYERIVPLGSELASDARQ